jgi:hypothetical protein
MFFAGLRGTGSWGTDERPKSFRELILWANPNGSAPLFALTSKAKTESVDDPEFSWWEETNTIARLKVNGEVTGGVEQTFVVDDGALQLIPGDVLQVELATQVAAYTPELIRVISVTSDTEFEAQRGVAGTTPATVANDLWLLRVGNAQSEGNLSPTSSSTNPTKFRNYTQIFKTPYTVTKTALKTKARTGDPLKNEAKRKTFQHSEKIEQALFWGIPYETVDATNGNQPLRFTGGIRNFIASNRKVYTATPTLDSFLDEVSPVFDYEAGGAGNERIIFAGNGALNTLNKLVAAKSNNVVNFDGQINYYGMKLSKYILPQGTVYFKTHPLMNVHPVYKNSMFIVNPAGIMWRPLSGRDTHIEKNIQPNDADYVKEQWLTEGGFEFHFERTMGYLGEFRTF